MGIYKFNISLYNESVMAARVSRIRAVSFYLLFMEVSSKISISFCKELKNEDCSGMCKSLGDFFAVSVSGKCKILLSVAL